MSDFIFLNTPLMEKIIENLKSIAKTNIPVFITGETGTGKSILARKIFELSQHDGNFIKIDCSSIPSNLIENELFGHEKGAYTGAFENKEGLLILANGGTLFIDEIENLELPIQAKLLNVLEDKKFRRIGGKKEIEIDFRLISACNINIIERINKGAFRQDLYYRIKGTEVNVPPLRERREDILLFAKHFLAVYLKKYGKNLNFTDSIVELINCYYWPGNIRELKNAVEEAVIKAKDNIIKTDDFPVDLQQKWIICDCLNKQLTLAEMEKKYIELLLKAQNYNKNKTTKILGFGLNTLYRKIKKYGLKDKN